MKSWEYVYIIDTVVIYIINSFKEQIKFYETEVFFIWELCKILIWSSEKEFF